MVIIDEDRCKGCGLCVTACPADVLVMSSGRFNAKGYVPIEAKVMEACTGCSVCALVCPDVVFTVYRRKKGSKRSAA
jgi:2-oxoglutarate ferredoxin oxidoreductase subunit delta